MKPYAKNKALILLVMVVSVISMGYFEQLTQATTGAPGETTCRECHTNPTSEVISGDVELTGMPAYVVGGHSYPMTLIVYTNDDDAQTAGFQLTMLNSNGTKNGDLTETDPNVEIQTIGNRQYAQHQPGVHFFSGDNWDTIRFNFTWTPSPVTQPSTVYSWYSTLLGNGNYLVPGGQRLDSTMQRSQTAIIVPELTGVINGISDPVCFGDASGSLEVESAGGLAPIQYSWSTGETTSIISGLNAGVYEVTIEDDAGQVIVLDYEIVEPDPISMNGSIVPPSCHDIQNGMIDLVIQGGTPPYDLFVNDEPSTIPPFNMAEGTYLLELIDINGCETSWEVDIEAPSPISFNTVEIGHQTAGNNGFIILEPEGGTPPYEFLWEGPNQYVSIVQNPTNLVAGTYFLTITDQHECEEFLTAAVDFVSANSHVDELLSEIHISPNPSTSHLIIDLSETTISELDVTVYAQDGKRVWNQKISNRKSFICNEAMSWNQGIYFIHLKDTTTGSSTTLRWIKSRI